MEIILPILQWSSVISFIYLINLLWREFFGGNRGVKPFVGLVDVSN